MFHYTQIGKCCKNDEANRLFDEFLSLRSQFKYEEALSRLLAAVELGHGAALFEYGRAVDYGELLLKVTFYCGALFIAGCVCDFCGCGSHQFDAGGESVPIN